MMINLLIDTNVWLYSIDKSSIYFQLSKSILINSNHNLFITLKNISEFFAVTSKKQIDPKRCLNSYHEMKTLSKILFPTERSLLIFEKLIQQYLPKGNQLIDIEIVSIMLDNGINQIATFNQKDFVNISEVQIFELR